MDFSYSDDQSMFVASCERLVREKCGFDGRRAVARSPADAVPPLWAEFAQLGLTALLVPEDAGGLGRPLIDGALVAQTLGRGWLLEPLVDCALAAAAALARCPQGAARDAALAAIADGSSIVVPLADAQVAGGAVRGTAPHASYASAVLFADAGRLCLLPLADRARRGWRQFDGTAAAEVTVARDAAVVVAQGEAAVDAWRLALAAARVGRIAEGVGLARTVLDATAEYLRTRRQFGQPIGRFQALAHRMADLAILHEQAQSLAWAAAMKLDAADGARTLDAAQVMAHRALRAIGQEAIQLHGGIGMTDELAVSHYVKRLLAIEVELGDADTALARFAAG
ncbi:MAG: acyl-CoA dehydrogenase family protein [Burkholderiales bacterium]|jgi:alkylation response protein AidB-like acyl-CoA dehydrogenase|nr:acyl-CoA dehydrogenase family protein [Burkholderiales bacterium]